MHETVWKEVLARFMFFLHNYPHIFKQTQPLQTSVIHRHCTPGRRRVNRLWQSESPFVRYGFYAIRHKFPFSCGGAQNKEEIVVIQVGTLTGSAEDAERLLCINSWLYLNVFACRCFLNKQTRHLRLRAVWGSSRRFCSCRSEMCALTLGLCAFVLADPSINL